MALHMELYGGRAKPVYWRHTVREAQAENVTTTQPPPPPVSGNNATQPPQTPVYGRIDARGIFGLYLEGTGEVDVLSFDTFAQNVTSAGGVIFRRMTLEDDGNLRAYYWTEESKTWTPDYAAISRRCGLPTSCGAYGLCVPGDAAQCQCLITTNSASTSSPPCHAEETADLCAGGDSLPFDVVRRTRVSVGWLTSLADGCGRPGKSRRQSARSSTIRQ
ncbi:hypothetical protein EJB05_29501, partial [Eragrostis curvula]